MDVLEKSPVWSFGVAYSFGAVGGIWGIISGLEFIF
jgi:hypothetical protein